jgi:cytochrome c biogenesis protein
VTASTGQQLRQPQNVLQRMAAHAVDSAWAALTSVRLALALILVLAASCFVGALVIQAPASALENSERWAAWLEQVRPRYGMWTDVFARLEFFNVFHSTWFRTLVVLLVASILVCTADRTPRLWRTARRRLTVRVNESLFERAPLRAAIPSPEPVEAALVTEQVTAALRRHRFSVREERDEDGTAHLVAEKNRYTPLGTVFHHAGIIVVLLGAIWGAQGGFRESEVIIPEGGEWAVEHDTGMTIRVNSFIDEYYAETPGAPKDYRSDVVVLRDGEQVAGGIIRVNEPLIHDGVRIHQAFFGSAVVMRVVGPDQTTLYEDSVPLLWQTQGRPAGTFRLPGSDLDIWVIAPASGFADPSIRPGEVRVEMYSAARQGPVAVETLTQGEAESIGGVEWNFVREARFTGLEIVKDPGLPLVWFGSAIVVLGASVVLAFPQRRLWARITPDGDGRATARIAAPRERGLPFDYEFRRIVEGTKLRLGARSDDTEST